MKKESRDHNTLYAAAQEKYLQNRTDKNLGELYFILLDYYQNQFINYSKRKCLAWTDDIIDEKAHDASTRIIERYLKNPAFKVERLTAYGHWDKLKVLYQDAEYEMRTTSLDDYSIGIRDKETGCIESDFDEAITITQLPHNRYE